MRLEEFQRLQREHATQARYSLAMTCRERFRGASCLMEIRGEAISCLGRSGHIVVVLDWESTWRRCLSEVPG